MFKYIAHPETGTPVHVKSHLGQNIINAYATKLEGGSDLVTIDDGDSCDSNNESHDVNKSRNGGGSHASRKSGKSLCSEQHKESRSRCQSDRASVESRSDRASVESRSERASVESRSDTASVESRSDRASVESNNSSSESSRETSVDDNSRGNETTSEIASRLKDELGRKGVVLNSRDVSRYSEGQYVRNIGKNKDVTGHVYSVIAGSDSEVDSVGSGRVGKLLIKLAV